MASTPPDQPSAFGEPKAASLAEAQRRQAAYVAKRRAWAERIGRPYADECDPRPPPGEVDAAADE
jgi:hypothetical protein